MSTTFTATEMAWVNMPTEQKEIFNNIAYKDGNPDLDGFDWFEHLVPTEIQDQPEMVEAFMNGGTVTQEVWVPSQGAAGGHYEQVDFNIADKDVSRITSGANGGDYTLDNTVMEDASANRARGGDNMTTDEFESIQEANAFEAELIDGGEVLTSTGEAASESLLDATSDLAGAASEMFADAVAPAIGAYVAAKAVSSQFKSTEDKVGYGALAAGGAALLCMTPVGQAGLALYAGTKLAVRISHMKFWTQPVPWAN